MTEQLSFALPIKRALGRADFFVSSTNAMALKQVEDWQNWPNSKLILTGPKGCGKSHLADMWRSENGADLLHIGQDLPADAARCVIEDIDQIAGDDAGEHWLFHTHNHLQNTGGVLLMTARNAPMHTPFTLPDLQSRLQACTTAQIDLPDDNLLQAVLLKHFSDRQLRPSPNVIPFLLTRIDRSFESAENIVAMLDKTALQRSRPITRAMAREVLGA